MLLCYFLPALHELDTFVLRMKDHPKRGMNANGKEMSDVRKGRASLWVLAVTVATVATLFLLPYTPKLDVQTVRVQRGDLAITTLLDGSVIYDWQQPCLALAAGKVSAVNVQKGQAVHEGDLLFRMDSAAEEQALKTVESALAVQQTMLSAAGATQAVQAMREQSLLSLRAKQKELHALVASKQIRAQRSGVVSGVYVCEEDIVAQGALLGLVCGSEKRIGAICRATDAQSMPMGALARLLSASGKPVGFASLAAFAEPKIDETTGQATQTLLFEPKDVQIDLETGDRVIVDVLLDAYRDVPLAPVGAVGQDGALWLVKDGKAQRAQIDASPRNAEYVRLPEEFLGCVVILHPDERALVQDCAVKAVKEP